MTKIGEKLRKARKNKNLTLEELEERTKIRKKYLRAIEEGNYEIIPGHIYIKAFIKGYANEIGLKGEEMVKKYEELLQQQQKNKKEKKQKENENKKFFHKKWVKLIIMLLITSLIFIVIYNVFIKQPEKSNSTFLNNNSSKKMQYDNLKSERNSNINNKKTIKIIASEKSWLQIYIDGKKIFQGFMHQGDIKKLNGEGNAVLKIGNGIAIKIKKEGKLIGPWGKRGEVIKKEVNF